MLDPLLATAAVLRPAVFKAKMRSATKDYRYGTVVGTFDGGEDRIRLDPEGDAPQSHALMPCPMKKQQNRPDRSNPSKRGLNHYEIINPSDDPCRRCSVLHMQREVTS